MTAPLEVGICVADLEAMAAFYTEVLGCHVADRRHIPAERTSRAGLGPSGVEIVWLQTPWGERIKLLQPGRRPPEPPGFVHLTARRGVAYLTFYVDDIAAADARARRAGARADVCGPGPIPAGPDSRIAFFRDPEGNVVELVERDDITRYRTDLPARVPRPDKHGRVAGAGAGGPEPAGRSPLPARRAPAHPEGMASRPSDTEQPGRRVIPEAFDPTFAGEPDVDRDIEAPAAEEADVLQLPGERRRQGVPEDIAVDPEDETLELPAEEQAMHVSQRRPRQPG